MSVFTVSPPLQKGIQHLLSKWLVLNRPYVAGFTRPLTIPALLAMKGHAIEGRYKQKDAYDIYYCIRNYTGGPEVLAEDVDRCSIMIAA